MKTYFTLDDDGPVFLTDSGGRCLPQLQILSAVPFKLPTSKVSC
jgi:hypothetical protein